MNKGFIFLAFTLGAAGGSFMTYKMLKKKYEDIVQEEIDSVKEMYRNSRPKQTEKADESLENDPFIATREEVEEYANKIKEFNYSDCPKPVITNPEVGPDPKDMSDPYVISPEEYGEDDAYDRINLTYYADGVVADENDEEVENVEGIIGLDSLETFGEYEDDSVHVKNDRTRAYYEILRDGRNYEDVVAGRPDPTDFYEHK